MNIDDDNVTIDKWEILLWNYGFHVFEESYFVSDIIADCSWENM